MAKVFNSLISMTGRTIGKISNSLVKRKYLYFPFLSELIAYLPFSPGWKLRTAVYSQILPAIGEDAVLHFGTKVEDERTQIGKDVWVSSGCYIDYAIIEDHVLIGPNTVILSGGNHHQTTDLEIPIKLQPNNPKEPTRIGRGAWIGANATVMAEVGNDAIVGAGAVVTKPVPSFAVAVGNPARVIKFRGEKLIEG